MARQVNRERYRRQHSEQHEVMLNVRLRAAGSRMPSEDEIRSAWGYTREHGRPPTGWEVAAVDWQHGSGTGWHSGKLADALAIGEGNDPSILDSLGGWDDGGVVGEPVRIGVEDMELEERGASAERERFTLNAGEKSREYRPGQFVSTAYAERYPWKVTRHVVAAAGEELDDTEGWEVEIAYDYPG